MVGPLCICNDLDHCQKTLAQCDRTEPADFSPLCLLKFVQCLSFRASRQLLTIFPKYSWLSNDMNGSWSTIGFVPQSNGVDGNCDPSLSVTQRQLSAEEVTAVPHRRVSNHLKCWKFLLYALNFEKSYAACFKAGATNTQYGCLCSYTLYSSFLHHGTPPKELQYINTQAKLPGECKRQPPRQSQRETCRPKQVSWKVLIQTLSRSWSCLMFFRMAFLA